MAVGVLALQGGFQKHLDVLHALNVIAREVRKPAELDGLDGLIIPGGESGALLKLMSPLSFVDAIQSFHKKGGCLFGTCAGAILLAKAVMPKQESIGLIDIDVHRNAYGRQMDSFVGTGCVVNAALPVAHVPCVFIRAPKISRVGEGVETLVTCQEVPVVVAQGRVMVATCHPELSADTAVHQHFVSAMIDKKKQSHDREGVVHRDSDVSKDVSKQGK